MPGPKKSDSLSFAAVVICLFAVALHTAVNFITPYGIHRDEFLYFAMGEHLRLWRMDFPPFIAVLSNATRSWLGNSLPALRFFPALASGLLMFLAVDAARRLGGKGFAQILAAVAVLSAVVYQRSGNLFQPVIFDSLWWTLGLWCMLRWRQSGNNRWWIAIGIVMGIGLFTKFSIVFFGFGVFVGLLATRERKLLATRWPWIAVILTLVIGLPSIVGQVRLGFPVVGQLNNLRTYQLARISGMDFIIGQAFILGTPVIIAAIGIVTLIVSKRFSNYRILGWTFVGSFAALFFSQGKAYYLGPIYPVMIAAGSVIIENAWTGRASEVYRKAVVSVVLLNGILILPLGIPILPPHAMEQYCQKLGIDAAVRTNSGTMLRLPQDYADMLGWEERVAEIGRIYKKLSAAQRADAIILAGNYGEAGAVDFYGPKYGLPHAICTSGSYWYFGPGPKPGKVAITIGCDEKSLKDNWKIVMPAGHLTNVWTVEEEQDLTFYLCDEEKQTAQSLWPLFEGRN